MQVTQRKVAIVGPGNVGSTFAFALMISGLAREIVLIGRDMNKAEGECMDLNHGASFVQPVRIYAAGYEGCKDADIVMITAGAKQKPGESRIDLTLRNAAIFKQIIPSIAEQEEDAILLVVSNPMDVLTYLTITLSGFPPQRVIGSGTVLDSSRFRFLISQHCRVDPRNVHAYIIGEHGDTELPVWSHANIGGMLFPRYCPQCKMQCDYKTELGALYEEVKNAAYKIIEVKGATYYAIALALVRIVAAILRDENSVLPVSTLIHDYYGINDVCLGVPAIVNRSGVERILRLELSPTEQEQLRRSAQALKEVISSVSV